MLLVLSKGSYDGNVFIWKEIRNNEELTRNWQKQETIKEIFGPIEDIQFSPSFNGFLLNCCFRESKVLLYKFNNSGKISDRSTAIEIEDANPRCVSWNKNPGHFPMFAIGLSQKKSDFCFQEVLKIYEANNFQEIFQYIGKSGTNFRCAFTNVSWAQNYGRKHHQIAVCGSDSVLIFKLNAIINTGEQDKNATNFRESTFEVISITPIVFLKPETPVFCIWNYIVE